MIFRSKVTPAFFEGWYRQKDDPWNFARSEYEQGRFHAIAQALSDRRYARALEPGCSIGTLTEQLAPLCDDLDAFDFSETAVAHARERCAALPQVHLRCDALSEKTTVAGYDLLVLSEIGYYFSKRRWPRLVHHIAEELRPGSIVMASHWLGKSKDHQQSGDAVHQALLAEPLLQWTWGERLTGFRMDRFVRL